MVARNAVLELAQDHPAAEGHFPGNRIMPGAVLLQFVARMVGEGRVGERCLAVTSAKFLAPVRPGASLALAWDDAGREIRFIASVDDVRAVMGVLRFGTG